MIIIVNVLRNRHTLFHIAAPFHVPTNSHRVPVAPHPCQPFISCFYGDSHLGGREAGQGHSEAEELVKEAGRVAGRPGKGDKARKGLSPSL